MFARAAAAAQNAAFSAPHPAGSVSVISRSSGLRGERRSRRFPGTARAPWRSSTAPQCKRLLRRVSQELLPAIRRHGYRAPPRGTDAPDLSGRAIPSGPPCARSEAPGVGELVPTLQCQAESQSPCWNTVSGHVGPVVPDPSGALAGGRLYAACARPAARPLRASFSGSSPDPRALPGLPPAHPVEQQRPVVHSGDAFRPSYSPAPLEHPHRTGQRPVRIPRDLPQPPTPPQRPGHAHSDRVRDASPRPTSRLKPSNSTPPNPGYIKVSGHAGVFTQMVSIRDRGRLVCERPP
jgi:hypothetical protein